MKLASRVTLTLTAVTAVVLIVSFAAVSLLISRDEFRDLDRALVLQAQASAERALLRSPTHPQLSDGQADVPEELGSFTRYAAIYDRQGRVLSFSPSFGAAAPPLDEFDLEWPASTQGQAVNLQVAGTPLRGVFVPVDPESRFILLFAVSRDFIDKDLQFLYQAASIIILAATLLTSLLASRISARIVRDVESVAQVARAVAQGDLSARVGDQAQDTEETRILASDMDHMIEQLSALVRSQQTFAYHAAHELRSPLTTIRGELQLALRRERNSEEYKKTIQIVLSDVDSLTTLVEELLELARVRSAKKLAPDASYVPLEALLQPALHLVEGTAQERQVTLTRSSPDKRTELGVRGAERELIRALRNLLENAILHTPPHSEVQLLIETQDEQLLLHVQDQGSGLPEEEKDFIFEPFFRGSVEQATENSGAGLGLPIARDIARAHGGDILLTAAPNGARFTLSLPLAPRPLNS